MAKRLICAITDVCTFRVGGLMARGWLRADNNVLDVRVTGIRAVDPWVVIEYEDGTETHLPQSRCVLGYGPEECDQCQNSSIDASGTAVRSEPNPSLEAAIG